MLLARNDGYFHAASLAHIFGHGSRAGREDAQIQRPIVWLHDMPLSYHAGSNDLEHSGGERSMGDGKVAIWKGIIHMGDGRVGTAETHGTEMWSKEQII